MTNDAGLRLRAILDAVIADPSLVESDTEGDGKIHTKCNWGVQEAAKTVGLGKLFDGMNANSILAYLDCEAKKHRAWLAWKADEKGTEPPRAEFCQVEAFEANIAANMGIWGIAAAYGKPHGHVASVYPGAMVWSSKWGAECPVVANIGHRDAVMGANYAFVEPPRYFVCRMPHNGLTMEP